MDSFYSASGSSPPNSDEGLPTPRLPEELVETLAALLAQAIVNDIRQYPDLWGLTINGTSVASPPKVATRRHQATRHRHTPKRARTRRSTRAS
jgi:hypothetical protein